MNVEIGKFCPFINKDCVENKCMLYDADSTFGPLCSIRSTAKYMKQMAVGDEALLGDDDIDDDELFEGLEDDDEESGDKPVNPENN